MTWKGDPSEAGPRGAESTYRDVQPGVDILVEAGPQGFEERVVVNEAPKRPLVLRFGLELRGLTARLSEQGGLELRDARASAWRSPTPLAMFGEVGRRSHEPLKQAGVATRLVEQGGQEVVELRPDPAFLRSVGGRVTIDPSANVTTNGDTYISSDRPRASYGGSTELHSGKLQRP